MCISVSQPALLGEQGVKLGAQNVSQHRQGIIRVKSRVRCWSRQGCRYVLVGHSERRRLFGETSFIVAESLRQSEQQADTHTLSG